MLLAGLPACGSSTPKCTTNCTDASSDSGGKHDANTTKSDASDALADHTTQKDAPSPHDAMKDTARDMTVDLANTCAASLTAACAATHDGGTFSAHCALTWDTTTRNAYLCARPATTVVTRTCGDFRELIDVANSGTEEYVYIYDSAGDLVAVTYGQYEDGGLVTHCIGGAAGFVDPPGCGVTALFTCPTDAGTHG